MHNNLRMWLAIRNLLRLRTAGDWNWTAVPHPLLQEMASGESCGIAKIHRGVSNLKESQNHSIISVGREQPKAGLVSWVREIYSQPFPTQFWISKMMEIPQPLWHLIPVLNHFHQKFFSFPLLQPVRIFCYCVHCSCSFCFILLRSWFCLLTCTAF